MDLNNSNQSPTVPDNTSLKYQDILDQYSKQITTASDEETEPEIHTPLPPVAVSSSVLPIHSPSSPVVLSPDPPTATSVEGLNFFKILFFISLLVFLIVVSILAISFINDSKTTTNSISSNVPVSPEPTNAQEVQTFCYLNDNKYNLNDTFPSTDGCNTCTCGLDGTIACTEKTCL